MRVLTIGNLYPPHHFGGYEQVWASAVRHLRERGHEVRVLAVDYHHPGQDRSDDSDVHRTLHWYWTDHDFSRFGLRRRLAVERHNQRELARNLEDFRPDVIGFWSMGGMSHSLIEASRRQALPIVAFVHDPWLDYGRWTDQWTRLFRLRRYHWVAQPIAALTGLTTHVDYGRAGRYVFVSEFLRRRMLALDLGLDDTAVASSGIASTFSVPGRPPDWQWRLLYVGRLHPDKGIEEAVRCLAFLPEEASLTVAGSWDPRDEAALERLIDELGMRSRVRALGRLGAEAVAELYRTSDALLFPVRWEEPWGLVPLEAMGCGCPVLATGRGGSAEYLRDGENCLLVPTGDPPALADAVRRLADHPELRDELRQEGLATAARHPEAAFNQAVEQHLRAVALAGADAVRPTELALR
jgi:glycosyltransferase involved in cell wall biosynthesis